MFLNDDYHKWFFGLSDDIKSDFNLFEKSYLEQSFSLKSYLNKLALDRQETFIKELKKKYSTDNQILDKINKEPITFYLKKKWKYISLVYKSISINDMISMSIYLLDETAVRDKLIPYRKSNLNDILVVAKYIDNI